MPEFLLEVGCEELPASFVEKAYRDLAEALGKELEGLGVKNSEPVCMGTPRRLIVSFADLHDRQADSTKEQRGPSLSAAFDATGEPTGALKGFCKSQGVEVADLRKDEQYVWVTKHIPGRPTAELLAEILPKAIMSLSFEKSMRWGAHRFARPIRWILAAFNGQLVSFTTADVPSGLQSCGHRFYAPEAFTATYLKDLVSELRSRKVEPEVEKRREMILSQTHKVAQGTAEISDSLLDENSFLCEWPTAISGSFPASFLELPEPVLVTAMAKHERMFPVRDAASKITNSFIFVRNSGEDDTVRRGCEWVLGARFNDARFFFEQDKKLTLDDFLMKTEGVIFQAQLGTVRQRIDRLIGLAENVAKMTGANAEETADLQAAAKYAKVDLATGLVSELSSLQGIIGGEYARREGKSEVVAYAISRQYDLGDADAETPEGRTAIRLSVVDQLDKLAGYLGLGMEPTGSSDPFGLRRAVTILMDCAARWSGFFPPYDQLLEQALHEYKEQGHALNADGAFAALCDIFAGRYTALMGHYRKDVLDAAMLRDMRWEVTQPRAVSFRAWMTTSLIEDEKFLQTAIRPMNIVAAAKRKGVEYAWENALTAVDVNQLNSTEGAALLDLVKSQEEAVFKAALAEDILTLTKLLQNLMAPLNAFFDNTMVMSENAEERYHRLSLAHAVSLQLLTAGDFTKIGG
jgi:glycyl-tRNA synthetase beta chain